MDASRTSGPANGLPQAGATRPIFESKWVGLSSNSTPLFLFCVFLITVLIAISIGINLFYAPMIERETFANLSAIARLKSQQLDSWAAERHGDATVIYNDQQLAERIALLLAKTKPSQSDDFFKAQAATLINSYGYVGICLLSDRGDPLSTMGDCEHTTPDLEGMISQSASSGITHSNMYRHGLSDIETHIDWLVPIHSKRGTDQSPIAFVLLRTSASRFIFPLIDFWPANSDSAETLLVRSDGEKIVHLNHLKHKPNLALEFSMPLGSDRLPSSRAVRSVDKGTAEGDDYRGVNVLAAYEPVTYFGWRVVAKIDRDEVMRPIVLLQYSIDAAAIGLALVMLLGFAAFLRQRNRLDHAIQSARRAKAEFERRRDAERFSSVFNLSPIPGVITCMQTGAIQRVNGAFEQDFGWLNHEISGQTALDLGLWQDPNFRATLGRRLTERGRVTDFETVLIRRDGRARNVLLSCVLVDLDKERSSISYIVDMTERNEVSLKLEAERQRLLAVLEGAPDALFVVDEAGSTKIANGQAIALFGYSIWELNERTIIDLVDDSERDHAQSLMEKLTTTGNVQAELVARTNPGRKVPVEFSASRLPDSLYLISCRDISARKASEAELRKLSLAIEQSPVTVAISNLAGDLEYVNDAFLTNTGYTREEVIGQNPRILKSGETPTETYHELWKTLIAGRTWQGEFHNRSKDGSIRIESAKIAPLRQPDGPITHYIAVKEDITDRKEMTAALEHYRDHLEDLVQQKIRELAIASDRIKEDEERLSVAIEAANDGIWEWNRGSSKFYVNTSYLKMLGYAPGDLGESADDLWANLIHPDERDRIVADARRRLHEVGSHELEYRLRAKDGSYRWVLARAKVVAWDEAGRPMRAVGIHTDMSARKQIEVELMRAKELAEKSNLAKSAFLANMSHEIRTPMNAIFGFTHILRQSHLDPKQSFQLDKITGATEHLLNILNDILDLSKIEANRLTLEAAVFNMSVLLDNVYSMFFEQSHKRGLVLSVDLGSAPVWLLGDATRVRQGLMNFVSNAIKFTEKGRIDVRVLNLGLRDDGYLLRFEVSDTGIGISKGKQRHLFEAFEQADASTTRKYGGTGLGLAITKRLAGLMGGTAGCESAEGAGSTFWFTAVLPAGQVDSEEAFGNNLNRSSESLLSKLRAIGPVRILVADDLDANRELIGILLDPTGFIVDYAHDGLQAVAMANQRSYGAILMDMQMPNMDGLQATRVILDADRPVKPPIIALTANAFVEDRQACKAAGMTDFIAKPVRPEVLFAVLARWLGPEPANIKPREPVSVSHGAAYGQSLIHFDPDRGLSQWGGNLAKYREFLAKFATEYRGVDHPVWALIEGHDLSAAAALVHKLRGAAANLALDHLASCASALEQALKSGHADRTLVERFKHAMEEGIEKISQYQAEIAALSPEGLAIESDADHADRPVDVLIDELKTILDADNPFGADAIISSLQTYFSAEDIEPLKQAVSNFDFRAAEQVLSHFKTVSHRD